MVVAAPTTPLPALSKGDKLRLTLYFSLGQSVEALALKLLDIYHQSHLAITTPVPFAEALTTENTALAPLLPNPHAGLGTRDSALLSPDSALGTQHSALPPDSFDLAAWTLSDPIAPHIAYRRAELAERRKQAALSQLDTILATSDSPIEKRRAATTMLRMLVRPNSPSLKEGAGGWVPGPQQTQPTPASPAPGTGGGRGARAAGGEASVSTHSPSPNTPPPPAHDANSSIPSAHPRPSASSAPSSDLGPASSPHPAAASLSHSVTSALPNPSLSPQQVITHFLRALEQPENPAHLATFESFLSPEATINDEPARPPLNPDQEAADPTTGETYTQLITPANSPATFKVTLTRPASGAQRNCWLLQSLDPDTT